MNFHIKDFILKIVVTITMCFLIGSALPGNATSGKNSINKSGRVERLKDTLLQYLKAKKIEACNPVVQRLASEISFKNIGDSTVWDSYYLIGIYHLISHDFPESIRLLDSCVSAKERNKEVDTRYSKAIYNLSVAYSDFGDLVMFEFYARKSLDTQISIYGKSNPVLINSYLSLAIAYTEKNEYEKAINSINTALQVANSQANKVTTATFANLYYSLGVSLYRMGNFSEARMYFDKTEAIDKSSGSEKDESYINLMNGLALTCNALGLTKETGDYYEKGIPLAISNNSPLAFNMINSYAVFLSNNKNTVKGEKLLLFALDKARMNIGMNPGSYFEVLKNYADFISENNINVGKSLEYYKQCLEYVKLNDHNIDLLKLVSIGYARVLNQTGQPQKALEILQSFLFPGRLNTGSSDKYDNPPLEALNTDLSTLKILKLKYTILKDLEKRNNDLKILTAASNTGELIVSVLDQVRITINEDASRLILGDKYRNSYLNVISDFNIQFNKTGDRQFLDKAFEYSEKSKVAGLLTSTRELKAAQFNIPVDIANYELELQQEISLINARISEESASNKPKMTLISLWKENLLKTSRKRDSLIAVFEKQYPEYYAIKYNTQTAVMNNIPQIVGSKGNYINYVVSDTLLYEFVVNKTYQHLAAVRIDSAFFNDIRKFRSLLAMPVSSKNALSEFNDFQNTGYRLYKVLIEPLRPYLISDNLILSPDNILCYLPFETIPQSLLSGEAIRYRDINYLMNDFNISYTYSATFMAESVKGRFSRSNKVIAFAPDYPEPINIQAALKSRQAQSGVLNDLPYARQEAKYVTDITGGTLYANSAAKESVYKNEAGKFDIIHLAMHTLLNDKDPMYSTLIFSGTKDSTQDGFLKTYEIYGIPLKAKMIVLSSCNTGSGQFFSGEGILSLARGFIYSGGQSVIMSMWEIEDKSGTDIVKMFYENLKKGYQKSVALKRARISFLKHADQLRSHPYFWSALVVYGDNTPLYRSDKSLITIAAICLIILLAGGYFLKRKYS